MTHQKLYVRLMQISSNYIPVIDHNGDKFDFQINHWKYPNTKEMLFNIYGFKGEVQIKCHLTAEYDQVTNKFTKHDNGFLAMAETLIDILYIKNPNFFREPKSSKFNSRFEALEL